MRANFVATLAVVALPAFSPSAAAEPPGRFHVGAGASYALTDGVASADTGGVTSVPIDGLPFEDEDVAWRAFVGWSPMEHWVIEAGYADLGRHESASLFTGVGPVATPGLVPRIPDGLLGLPGVIGPVGAFTVVTRGPTAGLDVAAWTFSATYSRSFAERWYGAATAGLAYASFETDGAVPVLVAFPATFANYPFATPDDETGWLWGVAIGWRFTPSWSLELAYRQYDVKVVEIENVGLDLRFSF